MRGLCYENNETECLYFGSKLIQENFLRLENEVNICTYKLKNRFGDIKTCSLCIELQCNAVNARINAIYVILQFI